MLTMQNKTQQSMRYKCGIPSKTMTPSLWNNIKEGRKIMSILHVDQKKTRRFKVLQQKNYIKEELKCIHWLVSEFHHNKIV